VALSSRPNCRYLIVLAVTAPTAPTCEPKRGSQAREAAMKRLGGFILSVTLFALALGAVSVLKVRGAGTEVTTNTTFAPLGSCIHGDCLSNRSNNPLAFGDSIQTRHHFPNHSFTLLWLMSTPGHPRRTLCRPTCKGLTGGGALLSTP
jgi:hypothetical protein